MVTQVSSDPIENQLSPVEDSSLATPGSKHGPICGSVCIVCSDIAPPNIVFRRHYGVICCEACKCFFRRTVQMGRDYKCRFGNSCPVDRNTINMKQVCQACRFHRCAQAGMKIESVKKFPRKSKEDSGVSTLTGTPSKKDKTVKLEKPIKREEQIDLPKSSHNGNKSISPKSVTIVTTNHENSDNKPVADNVFDYESDFEQFKFNIASPELSLYNTVLDTAMPKLFSGESLENIHEKSSIPTPESISGEISPPTSTSSNEKIILNINKGSPGRVVGIAKQASPLVLTKVSETRSHTGTEIEMVTDNQSTKVTSSPHVSMDTDRSSSRTQDVVLPKKRPSSNEVINWNEMLAKKMRLEEALNHISARQAQVTANLKRLSASVATQNRVPSLQSHSTHQNILSSYTSLPHHNTALQSPSPGGLISPPMNQETINNQTPYVTPHETPHGTPVPSPLPSPCMPHSLGPSNSMAQHQSLQDPNSPYHLNTHSISQPGTPMNGSVPSSPMGYAGQVTPSSSNNYHMNSGTMFVQHSSPGPVFFGSQVPVPLYSHPLVPTLVRLPSGLSNHPKIQLSAGNYSGQSPFSGIPFKHGDMAVLSAGTSMSGSLTNSPIKDDVSELPSPSFTHDSDGKLAVEVPEGSEQDVNITRRGSISATTSACPSPVPKPSRTLASDAPEAEVDEVLDSLRSRIRSMFKWAKSEVEDFEDLSPLDQKALLRRTVSELVMLGFARVSIPYDGMLLLGSTGKVMRPTNRNSGVATVAMVTLSKLVIPLKVLNIDDKELNLMKEIVLFNPESNGLCNRETVRQYRKRKHRELMEYSEKNEPGRFGELICLLTPLYEVSLEVTEQLRLEQFVHEGEARIDALLLMSMINQGGGTVEEPIDDVGGN